MEESIKMNTYRNMLTNLRNGTYLEDMYDLLIKHEKKEEYEICEGIKLAIEEYRKEEIEKIYKEVKCPKCSIGYMVRLRSNPITNIFICKECGHLDAIEDDDGYQVKMYKK